MVSGDRIGYSAHFVAGPGCYAKEIGDRRGTLVALDPDRPFCTVKWDDEEHEQRAHVSNIARVGSLAFADPHHKPRT